MRIQSFTRRHPFALGIATAVFFIVSILTAMRLQGFPIDLFLNGETFPKLVLGGIFFGALMTGFALVLGRVSDTVEPALSPYKKVIWPVSIAVVAAMFYFIIW